MTSRGFVIEGGEIHLLEGRHSGPNSGFGAAHIWAEHAKEMARQGLRSRDEVPAYVASIVKPGTPLVFGGPLGRQVRLIAVRSRTGMAILELRMQRDDLFWSVVTAYAGSKAHGTRVGAVL